MKYAISILPLMYEDLPEIAELHVRIWQQAYQEQMPQEYLDALDVSERLKSWHEGFERNKSDTRYGTLVARISGKMAGFLSYGPARDEMRTGWTEIYAINVLKEYWSAGIGHSLFTATREIFIRADIQQTYLWVLDTNRNALNAYRRWQGIIEEGCIKNISIGNSSLKEICVSFHFPRLQP